MAEPYLGEIRMFGFNFNPQGWELCNGQLLQIVQFQALFSLLGTAYGGDGVDTFGLPDLRGRVPLHAGEDGPPLGQKAGQEGVQLSLAQIPNHTHALMGSGENAVSSDPSGRVLARSAVNLYKRPAGLAPMASGAVTTAGTSAAHNNMQPYLAINFCIATQGLFPS